MTNYLNRRRALLLLGMFVSLLFGCVQTNGESMGGQKVLEGRISYESSEEPLAHIEVVLFRLDKPLFSMRGWERVSAVKTDEEGYFLFEINKAGPYEVRWNPESNIVPHEFPVEDFEGRRFVEIPHEDEGEKSYPWED